MKWQLIETAPKDGTWFLAFYPKIEAHCFQGQWKVARWVKDWFHEGYPGVMDAAEHEEFDQPTYWMPLPPEPWRQIEEPKQSEGDEVEAEHSEASLTHKLISRLISQLTSVEKDTEYQLHEPYEVVFQGQKLYSTTTCTCALCAGREYLAKEGKDNG